MSGSVAILTVEIDCEQSVADDKEPTSCDCFSILAVRINGEEVNPVWQVESELAKGLKLLLKQKAR